MGHISIPLTPATSPTTPVPASTPFLVLGLEDFCAAPFSDLLALPDKDERLSQQPQSKNVLDNCDLSDINQCQQSQEEIQQKQNQNDHKK